MCKRDQDTVNECVRDSIEKLRPKLVEGIPELNVPSLDPFYIHEVCITFIWSAVKVEKIFVVGSIPTNRFLS